MMGVLGKLIGGWKGEEESRKVRLWGRSRRKKKYCREENMGESKVLPMHLSLKAVPVPFKKRTSHLPL